MPKQRKHLVDYGSARACLGKTTSWVKRPPTPRWESSCSPDTRLCQAGTTRWPHQKCKLIFARPLSRVDEPMPMVNGDVHVHFKGSDDRHYAKARELLH